MVTKLRLKSTNKRDSQSRQRGFTLVVTAISTLALFGAAGLAFDIGRIYITKNEAQSYADAAALSAAMELDGTLAGLTRADAAVAASTNSWNLGTQAFRGTVVEYSSDGSSGWAASGSAVAPTQGYVRVTATVDNLQLCLLPVIGTDTMATVKASALAGQVVTGSPVVFPYAPIAHDSADPNCGFEIGQRYDLKWPQSPEVGTGNKAPCDGDNAQSWVNLISGGPPELGAIAFSGTSGVVSQIENDVRPYDPPLEIGQYLNPASGDKNAIVDVINARRRHGQPGERRLRGRRH